MADSNIFGMKTALRRENRKSDGSGHERKPDDEEAQRDFAPQLDSTSPEIATSSATDDAAAAAATQRARKATDSSGSSGTAAEPVRRPKKEKTALFKKCHPKEPFTVSNQIRRIFLGNWINVLLFAAPVGIALDQVDSVSRVVVFVVNFVAIIPLAALLSYATEEIALRTGETLGGLLNATFGNAVELIVAIIALGEKKVKIVQTSLIGSILSNLLLVLGMCFFCGGVTRPHQNFNTTVAQTAASLLALAVASVIVPTVFDQATETEISKVAAISRGTSIILLVVYGAYLFFQLKTHSSVFMAKSEKVPERASSRQHPGVHEGLINGLGPAMLVSQGSDREQLKDLLLSRRVWSRNIQDDEEEEEEPTLHFAVAVALLTGSTVIIAFCAEFMVSAIDAVTAGGKISEEFIGLILLPIVGNAAEHVTAITVAMKDKMDLAIGVAVGSSMQVALFLIPLLVVIGWGMGNDEMSLSFDTFQVAVLFVSVLLCNYLIADGKSHWLEGMLLVCLYAIIAVCSWFYPNSDQQLA